MGSSYLISLAFLNSKMKIIVVSTSWGSLLGLNKIMQVSLSAECGIS